MARPPSPADHTDTILKAALEIQARHDAARLAAREHTTLQEAAAELGLDAAQLAAAERLVAARARRAAVRREGWRGVRRALAAVGAVVALTLVGHLATRPGPAWAERFEPSARARWSVATNPGTLALLRWKREGDRDIAMVSLDHASTRDTDRWFVDLEGQGLPPVDGHEAIAIELAGSLPHARLCLYATHDERWCSPILGVRPQWSEHRLALASLVHERVERGRWRERPRLLARAPHDVRVVALQLGRGLNPDDRMGVVRVGELRVE